MKLSNFFALMLSAIAGGLFFTVLLTIMCYSAYYTGDGKVILDFNQYNELRFELWLFPLILMYTLIIFIIGVIKLTNPLKPYMEMQL